MYKKNINHKEKELSQLFQFIVSYLKLHYKSDTKCTPVFFSGKENRG